MANTPSAEKNIRKTAKRTKANRLVKSRIRSIRKKVLGSLAKGDLKGAQGLYNDFAAAADKAAKTHVIHKNAASRLKSRVALKFKALDKKP